jgi:hypothetical protein
LPIFVLFGGSSDVAALASDFLVTGLWAPSYPQYVGSYGARVRGSDGAVLDNPQILIGGSYATRARVETLGGNWIVVTERHATHNSNVTSIEFSFVSPNGVATLSPARGRAR